MTTALEHGACVRCIKPCGFNEITVGEVYRTFGTFPKPPGWPQELSICVPDPEDKFGGVLSVPVECFDKARQ